MREGDLKENAVVLHCSGEEMGIRLRKTMKKKKKLMRMLRLRLMQKLTVVQIA